MGSRQSGDTAHPQEIAEAWLCWIRHGRLPMPVLPSVAHWGADRREAAAPMTRPLMMSEWKVILLAAIAASATVSACTALAVVAIFAR